jgi:phosphatidylglycerophosphate synthase
MKYKSNISIINLREICQPKEILDRQNEDWYAKIIGRKVSIYFTKIFIIMGLTPNTVTFLSLFVVFLGAFIFTYSGVLSIVAFFLLFQFSFILDSCDGEVARYSRKFTRLGGLLESVSSTLMSLVLYLSIAVRLWNITENAIFIVLGLLGAISDVMRDVIVYRKLKLVEEGISGISEAENKSVFAWIYRVYSGLKINELYYPRGRVILFFIFALLDLFFSFSFVEYLLVFLVFIGLTLLIFAFYIIRSRGLESKK